MAEYIDRDELYEQMHAMGMGFDLIEALEMIENFPAADVAPVVRKTAEGERKMEWISVKDRLPEEYRDEYRELIPFLVVTKRTKYPFRAFFDGTCWGDGFSKLKVTHWMPLPKPPKEGEHETD